MGDGIPRLENMISERRLSKDELISGKRSVAAVLYPQWLGPNDGGLGMRTDEVMAGCVAGILPSQYEPFLLTALEAGERALPSASAERRIQRCSEKG